MTTGRSARKLSRSASWRSNSHDPSFVVAPRERRPSRGSARDGRGGRDGEVRAVSLSPSSGRAELVIAVQGAVTVADRTLPDPSRIVLDVSGATLAAGSVRSA